MMARFVNSVVETAKDPTRIEHLIWVDNSDPLLGEYMRLLSNIPMVRLFVGDKSQSKDVVGAIWNELASQANGQLLMMGNDDLMCTSQNWDVSLDNTVRRYADKLYVAWFNDGINGQKHCAFPIVSRKWYETLGYFVPEDFMFFCHDTYLFHLARDLGRLLYIPDRLEHWHHSTPHMKRDETTKRNRDNGQSPKDLKTLTRLEKSPRWQEELGRFRDLMRVSPYKKDKRLSSFLKGKRIALVGPATTLMGMGMGFAIDQYDVVCRINEVFPFGQEQDYGSRVDIVFHACAAPTIPNLTRSLKEDPFITKTLRFIVGVQQPRDGEDNREESLRDIGSRYKIQTHHIGLDFWQFVADELRASPNSGTMAIRTLLEYDLEELLITGFDFYTGELDHHPAYELRGGDDVKPEDRSLHDQGEQLRHLQNVILPRHGDRITLDSRIQELTQRTSSNVFDLETLVEGPVYTPSDVLGGLVDGKRVVLVGPSPHLEGLGRGEEIDQYDVVCRVNELMPIGLEADYGSRTDVVFHCCGMPALQRYASTASKHSDLASTVKLLVCPQAEETKQGNMVQNWEKIGLQTPFHHVGQVWWYKACREIGVASNTGLLALMLLLKEYSPAEVHVTGFSFYAQGLRPEDRHHSSYLKWGGDKTATQHLTPSGQCGERNQAPQREYMVKYLIPEYRRVLTTDDFLMEALKKRTPALQYGLRAGSTYAVYRCLYGQEFIEQSIRSVLHVADRVFVYWTNKPFANVRDVTWEGMRIRLPATLPDIREKVQPLVEEYGDRVVLQYDHWGVPDDQFTHLINDRMLKEALRPDYVICMEPDMVWKHGELEKALQTFIDSGKLSATFPQVELWKHLTRRIPERPKRIGPVFFSMAGKYRNGVPKTGKSANTKQMVHLNGAHVHNLGFCVHPRTMLLKHLLAIGFSAQIEDSPPNEQWLLDKWMAWDPADNDNDLEISKGREHTIPNTQRYSRASLPEVLR